MKNIREIEREHERFMELIEKMSDDNTPIEERQELSVELARAAGVEEDRIIHNIDELDKLFK